MPMTNSGPNPIEYYYPNGFGETASNSACIFKWKPIRETIPNEIFEQQTVGPNKCIRMSVRADYTQCLPAVMNGTYNAPPGTSAISSVCCGPGSGPIKYALLGGEFPPSLYLDIDTGEMRGHIDELEKTAPERLNMPKDFKFDETNYLKYYIPGLNLRFLVRAFDSGDPSSYSDTFMILPIRTNWSARRDRFVLNIQNQFYLDGKPVDNGTYIRGMKAKGYYPGPGCG